VAYFRTLTTIPENYQIYINECGKKAYFCQNQGVLNFCIGANPLLMRMQKIKTTQSLATKMLFRPGSLMILISACL